MANKRKLKKHIIYVCGDVATECLIAAEYVKGIDGDTTVSNTHLRAHETGRKDVFRHQH
ncbi:MAG: hypothetical protein K2L78_07420 [Muribaculaceae bacterium]|nr:hypothetical protein [Muribaculaceae bacterium]